MVKYNHFREYKSIIIYLEIDRVQFYFFIIFVSHYPTFHTILHFTLSYISVFSLYISSSLVFSLLLKTIAMYPVFPRLKTINIFVSLCHPWVPSKNVCQLERRPLITFFLLKCFNIYKLQSIFTFLKLKGLKMENFILLFVGSGNFGFYFVYQNSFFL